MIYFISSFEIISVAMPVPDVFFWIAVFVAEPDAVTAYGNNNF